MMLVCAWTREQPIRMLASVFDRKGPGQAVRYRSGRRLQILTRESLDVLMLQVCVYVCVCVRARRRCVVCLALVLVGRFNTFGLCRPGVHRVLHVSVCFSPSFHVSWSSRCFLVPVHVDRAGTSIVVGSSSTNGCQVKLMPSPLH